MIAMDKKSIKPHRDAVFISCRTCGAYRYKDLLFFTKILLLWSNFNKSHKDATFVKSGQIRVAKSQRDETFVTKTKTTSPNSVGVKPKKI